MLPLVDDGIHGTSRIEFPESQSEEMEDTMIARILKSIHLDFGGGASGFDRYFQNIQSPNRTGTPSREEARAD
jgi:hypothetical protein